MVYYIISDIHGNFDALKVCLEDIKRGKPGQVICLGDIVGYGVEPNECIDTVRGLSILTVMGNHDHSAISDQSLEYFNQYAKEAMLWTRKVLRPENLDYLRNLDLIAFHEDMCLVHATPHNPEEWNYIFYLLDAEINFRAFTQKICFVGHSHQPVILEENDGKIFINRDGFSDLQPNSRYIVNVGSVGQPRDQDPRLCYCIYDSDENTVELRRLEYPVEAAQEKMRAVGLHPFLIERLSLGR